MCGKKIIVKDQSFKVPISTRQFNKLVRKRSFYTTGEKAISNDDRSRKAQRIFLFRRRYDGLVKLANIILNDLGGTSPLTSSNYRKNLRIFAIYRTETKKKEEEREALDNILWHLVAVIVNIKDRRVIYNLLDSLYTGVLDAYRWAKNHRKLLKQYARELWVSAGGDEDTDSESDSSDEEAEEHEVELETSCYVSDDEVMDEHNSDENEGEEFEHDDEVADEKIRDISDEDEGDRYNEEAVEEHSSDEDGFDEKNNTEYGAGEENSSDEDEWEPMPD